MHQPFRATDNAQTRIRKESNGHIYLIKKLKLKGLQGTACGAYWGSMTCGSQGAIHKRANLATLKLRHHFLQQNCHMGSLLLLSTNLRSVQFLLLLSQCNPSWKIPDNPLAPFRPPVQSVWRALYTNGQNSRGVIEFCSENCESWRRILWGEGEVVGEMWEMGEMGAVEAVAGAQQMHCGRWLWQWRRGENRKTEL